MNNCIYQLDNKGEEKIIKIMYNENNFLNIIREIVECEYLLDEDQCPLLENVSEGDLKSNDGFKEHHYLLFNDNLGSNKCKQIKLVQKRKVMNKGYLYNSVDTIINTFATWKLLPMECAIPCSCETKCDVSGNPENSLEYNYVNDVINTWTTCKLYPMEDGPSEDSSSEDSSSEDSSSEDNSSEDGPSENVPSEDSPSEDSSSEDSSSEE